MRRPLVFLLIGIAIGVLVVRYHEPAIDSVRDVFAAVGVIPERRSPRIAHERDALQRNPLPIACPDPVKERVAVLLIGGQSNAANDGALGEPEPTYTDTIVNLWDGKCFVARHPLLGATSGAQSPWIETARLLIETKKFDKVVIIATAVGGTGAHEWAQGEFYERLLDRIGVAKTLTLTPTHFLWHQGEHEAVNGKPGAAYEADVISIINAVRRQVGSDIPALIALASRCQHHGPSTEIRDAQRRVASSLPNVVVAVDSDAIGLEHRYDGCHMTKSGQELLAKGYADAVIGSIRSN